MRSGFTLIEMLAATVLFSLLAQAVVVTIRLANRGSDHTSWSSAAHALHPDRLTGPPPPGAHWSTVILPSESPTPTTSKPAVEWIAISVDNDKAIVRLRLKPP